MASPLERIYPYLPVWAQNAGLSLYGAAYRYERLGGAFDEYVREFRRRERFSKAEMEAYLDESLSRLLARSFDQCAWYRERLSGAGFRRDDLLRMRCRDLPLLPITDKQSVRSDPYAFVAADARRSALHEYHTSGSTGTPIRCVYSTDAHRRFYAAREARSFAWAGTSIRARRSMIGGRIVVAANAGPPFYRYNRAERQVYFSAFHISPSRIWNYVEGFERHRPEVLTGYAHAHYLLSRMMIERGLSLGYEPRAAVLGSEKLTPEMKCSILQALRVRAYEEYGSVENCFLATECEAGSLHAHPDFGIVEIVDDRGFPVPEGAQGRVVCTGLLNDAQILIRYRTGDLAAWSRAACPCGRDQLPVIREIAGREEDVVVTADGRATTRFHGLFVDVPGIIEGQVIQEELDVIRVRIVPGAGFGPAEQTIIERRVRERLGHIRVLVEEVAELPRTSSGKLRAVVSLIGSRSEAVSGGQAG